MHITLQQFLIVCPLVGLAGFIDAIAGGGGLISLPAYLFAGFDMHTAIGTSKLSATMGSTIATVRYARMGYIPLKISVFCVAAALAGSSIGTNINLRISDYWLRVVMLVLLPILAVKLTTANIVDRDLEPYDEKKTLLLSVLVSFFVGMYDGFYGPGTGTFMILLYMTLAHHSLNNAQGISKIVNLTSTGTAVAIFLMNGKAVYSLGIIAGLCNIAGSVLGTKFYKARGAKGVKPVMLCVLAIFFVKLLIEFLQA